MDEVEDFLAHYGVKGMRWGERKTRPSSSGSSRRPSKETVKNAAVELGFGSLGPAAVIAGLGAPVSIAIGLSAAVLSKPPVRQAIARSTKSSAALIKEVGDTKLAAMKMARDKKRTTKKVVWGTLDAAAEAAWLDSLDRRLNS